LFVNKMAVKNSALALWKCLLVWCVVHCKLYGEIALSENELSLVW